MARTFMQDAASGGVWGWPGEAWHRPAAEAPVALPDVQQGLLERLKRADVRAGVGSAARGARLWAVSGSSQRRDG